MNNLIKITEMSSATQIGGDKCFTYDTRSLSLLQSIVSSFKAQKTSVCSSSTGILWDLGQGILFLWRKSQSISIRLVICYIQKDEGWLIQTSRAVKIEVLLYDSWRSPNILLLLKKATYPPTVPTHLAPLLPSCCHEVVQVKADHEDKQNEYF